MRRRYARRPPRPSTHDDATVAVLPAVAMRHLVAAIGAEIAHRSAGRDHDVADIALLPRAGVGVHAHLAAGRARLRQRQHALDHGPRIMGEGGRRFGDNGDPGHGGEPAASGGRGQATYAVAGRLRSASACSARCTFCNSRWLVSLRK